MPVCWVNWNCAEALNANVYPKFKREASYYNIVREIVLAQPDCFIRQSFKIDEYGTASELLRWRDELTLAGWNSRMKGISAKLNLLADIEDLAIKKGVNIKGESDRWRTVMNADTAVLQAGDAMIIHFPREHLPPYLTHFFDKLVQSGISCIYKFPETSIAPKGTNLEKIQKALLLQKKEVLDPLDPVDKESFRIFRFHRQVSAMEWVVTQNYSSDTVFINSDNRSFDIMQMLFGNPLSGSSLPDANPEIVQMFKLGCSLFLRPLNVYNLLSYLQISLHPLNSSLRRSLTNVIITQGGIVNPEWEKVIAGFITEKNENQTRREQEIMTFLPLGKGNNDIISLSSMKSYVNELRTWASKTLIVMSKDPLEEKDELILQQFSSLINFCNAFIIILNGQTTYTVTSEKLRSWILSVYKPTKYYNNQAQARSRFVTGSPAAFADTAEKVVWMDLYNGTPKASLFEFLSDSEFKTLTDQGILLWSEEEQIKAQLYEQKLAILNCRSRFTAIVPEKDKGEPLNAHPILVQLAAQFKNLKSTESINPVPEGEKIDIAQHTLPETAFMIDMEEKKLFTPREKESYSSISELIQNPLDYVLNYQAKLSGSNVIELSDEKRTMGNVAHLFIEQLVIDSEKDLQKMKQLTANDFQNRLSRAVLRKGAVLLLDENKILLTRFTGQLRQSVNNLLDIIQTNNLKVVGCEVLKECKLTEKLQMGARIDLLLSDSNSDSVIFNMKWTSSKTYYSKLIKENRALQLEVYSQVLKLAEPGSQISAVAYFDLSHGRLETSYRFTGDHIYITAPDNTEDIFKQAMNSYSYRWRQLQDGIIEVAEQMDLEDLDYHNDGDTKNLFPLETDYNKKNLKAINSFSNFLTFKGGLK